MVFLVPIFAVGFAHGDNVDGDGNKGAVESLRCLRLRWPVVASGGKS